MFRVDLEENRIIELSAKSFSELGVNERDHLQEWLVNTPTALGEELLIIQKEFDGFNDTRERLDLLALDKEGQLVIIENKLDDSGRDVVWQALKYTSYCSSLKKNQIISVYQRYLDRYCGGGDAIENICSFLEKADIDEALINSGNDQRILLVAASFRKEVTSTVMWLLSHGIRVQCFKVTPYKFDEQLFMNVDQIIPTREAEEFMISMSAKEAEENNTKGELRNSHTLRLEFWERTLEVFRNKNIPLYQNVSPSKDHWLNTGSGYGVAYYTLIFAKNEIRVELGIARSSKEENKAAFDALYALKTDIENRFGDSLHWERLDHKKMSRVTFRREADGFNKSNWPEMSEWLVNHMQKLDHAFKPALAEVNKQRQ